jgi:hypothetical protein
MSLWGTADAVYSTGTITVDYAAKTITGSGTTFSNTSEGDVISIGVGNTYGEAVISSVTSDTELVIKSTEHLISSVDGVAGLAYTVSQKPVYTLHDSHYDADRIFGVDNAEVNVARTTKYSVAHGGWVGIITYMDNSQTPPVLRVKTEVLVAMGKDADGNGGISSGTPSAGTPGDAADDAQFADT